MPCDINNLNRNTTWLAVTCKGTKFPIFEAGILHRLLVNRQSFMLSLVVCINLYWCIYNHILPNSPLRQQYVRIEIVHKQISTNAGYPKDVENQVINGNKEKDYS